MTESLAIVTGGSSGLGEKISKYFIDQGIFTVVVSRKAKDTFTDNRDNYTCLNLDLSESEGIEDLISFLSKYKTANEIYIINNLMFSSPFETLPSLTADTIEDSLSLGLWLPIRLTQAFYPIFETAAKGRIINIGSFLSDEGAKNSVIYSMIKHALLGFTRSVALELINTRNTTCNMISPGYLDTDMLKNNPDYQKILDSNQVTSFERVLETLDLVINDSKVTGKNYKVVGTLPVDIN